jgi:hypothetical protein
MRPQLTVGGLLITLMGAGFYFLEIPLVYFWSIPFVVGGGLMMAASLFLSESSGPIAPPAGFRYCVFCSTPIPLGAARCQHCNGLQPREGT